MKSEWKVFQTAQLANGRKFYQIGRIRDIRRPVHYGNVEWYSHEGYTSREMALYQRDKLNAAEAKKKPSGKAIPKG